MRPLPALTPCLALALLLAACERPLEAPPAETDQVETADAADAKASVFPPELEAVEGGYPTPEAPCRRLGDSIATANWAREGSILFGCPSFAAAADLKAGTVVEKVGGITLVAVPLATVQSTLAAQGRTLAANRGYDARLSIPCGVLPAEPEARCMAGVIRATDGTPGRLEIQRPDGEVRAFLVEGNRILGIDPKLPPQSPDQGFTLSRTGTDDPASRVRLGEDVFIVPDRLLVGAPPAADAAPDGAPPPGGTAAVPAG